MYSLRDIVRDLLDKTAIKKIARSRKVSKNTVKKYRDILNVIIKNNRGIENNIDAIMELFLKKRKDERYSDNFGWLSKNNDFLEEKLSKCTNLVRVMEVLDDHGFKGSYSSLLRYLHKNKAVSEKPVIRVETPAGEIAQVDFGFIGQIYDEEEQKEVKAYIFVLVLCYSRHAYYEIVKDQGIETWCNCHIHAFEYFGGVPGVIIPDNLKSAIIKASFCEPLVNRTYADLAQHYGFQIDPCLPGTPEHKGKVESGVKYAKNNFIPLRSFKNFADANNQLSEWNEQNAKTRIHGTTRRQPIELFELYEKKTLTTLPVTRFEIPIWKQSKVYRDIHIQLDNAYYSVPHELRGEYVMARKTKLQVTIFHDNKLVAVHLTASKGIRRTNKDHYPPDEFGYMQYDTSYCLKEAKRIGENSYIIIDTLLNREPIRNLRSSQNILRMEKKYTGKRLEAACKRALKYQNFSYGGIKNILEKRLDQEDIDTCNQGNRLDSSYARDIKTILGSTLN